VVGLEGAGRDEITAALSKQTPDRRSFVGRPSARASRREVVAITHYDPWFLRHIHEIIAEEKRINKDGLPTMPRGCGG